MSRARGVGFYAPSGFALDPAAIDRAVTLFEARGDRVTVDPTCRMRVTRFAASDDERLAAVMRMTADPHVDLAITLRGGYGWTRLLPRLDYAAIAAAGKQWLGYSDFTAFQLAALAGEGGFDAVVQETNETFEGDAHLLSGSHNVLCHWV